MRCWECGKDFAPDDEEEEICHECQAEARLEDWFDPQPEPEKENDHEVSRDDERP